MRYSALHGSPGEAFDRFDPTRGGSQSGYDHARTVVCFTSSVLVAQHYADGDGFVGRFSFEMRNPWEMPDTARAMGITSLLESARDQGYDGVILRACAHAALSPGEASDLYFLFDPISARRTETLQERDGEDEVQPRRARKM